MIPLKERFTTRSTPSPQLLSNYTAPLVSVSDAVAETHPLNNMFSFYYFSDRLIPSPILQFFCNLIVLPQT